MAPSPRRPYTPRLPPEQRREQLLDAALQIIARDGYAGVSIEAIAREAGVTRPVVYSVYDSLGPLLHALLARQEERALAQLMAVIPAEADLTQPDALLLLVVRRLVEVVGGDPLTWRPILLAPEGTPPAVRARIAADREVVRARVEDLVRAALTRRPGLAADPAIVAHGLIAMAEHFGRLIVEDPERFDAEGLLRTIEALIGALAV
jgi:AcrR family transcriptional regulator